MARRRLCKNVETGAIYVWNEYLANEPDIVLLTPEEEKKYYASLNKKKESLITKVIEETKEE